LFFESCELQITVSYKIVENLYKMLNKMSSGNTF